MSKLSKILRSLMLLMPIVALSIFVIFQSIAQSIISTAPSGQISSTTTQGMPNYTSYPNGSMVGVTTIAPIAMIVESTDEQLFYKAYTDYTPISNTTVPDITYSNSFVYQGYFNPDVCYSYSSNQFAPAAAASNHTCSGYYSGNFMNWVTMSRLDMLRYAMYGGLRTTDVSGGSTSITRAVIPNDGHAWVKVYSGTDVAKYVPNISGNSVSMCNAYVGNLASASTTSTGLHIAKGTYTQWASMEGSQCTYTSSDANAPTSGNDFVVSVQVCDANYDKRSMCKTYGTSSVKPTGVLQQFGQSDSAQQIKFAMISGSRAYPRTGGILRKNASFIEGNLTSGGVVDHTCATASNEVNLSDGTFCAQTGNSQGIIQNLSLIGLNTTGNTWSGSNWSGCSTYGIYNRYPGFSVNGVLDDPGSTSGGTQYHCGAWGNPVAEMYGEALRYMSGASAATSGFDGSASDGLGMTSNLAWVPPVTDANYCASCAIVLISSGGITFDGDEIPTLTSILRDNINTATDLIGTNESIAGNNFIVGRMLSASTDLAVGNSVNTTSDVCQGQTVSKFSLVRGICPDGGSLEGSYLVAGEAWQAWTNGITLANVATAHQIKPVKTYAVALSESMPTFNIVTSTGTVTLAPVCQSSNGNPSTAPAETGSLNAYRTCGLLALQLGQSVSAVSPYNSYGKTFDATGKTGSFTVIWDDSTWGNDHDLDVTSVVSWCVGAACGSTSDTSNAANICFNANLSTSEPPFATVTTSNSAVCSNGKLKANIAESQVIVRTEILTANAGNDLALGFSVAGASSGNGVHRVFYRPGGQNSNLITGTSTYPNGWTPPQVEAYTGGGAAAGNLQNPLWYAAKYGGFNYTSQGAGLPAATTDAVPTLASQWQGTDGNPSNYFLARNPSDLVTGLQKAFQQIANSGNSANNFGNATTPSSSNDISGNGLSYQVQYFLQRNGVSWTGGLQAFWSDSNGYLREGFVDGTGNQVLSSSANYVVSGPDTSPGALPNAITSYRCSSAPVPPVGSTTFDPSTSGACSIVSANNLLIPAWDATTALDAYYDPTAASGTADANAIALFATQRKYSDDPSASNSTGQRYIFTYLTATPNGSTASGTVTNGTQTDFVWNPASCGLFGAYTLSATSGFCGSVGILGTGLLAGITGRLGNFGLLNEQSPALAQNLVNWVRGVEDPTDYRTRTSNLQTGKNIYRLGDIVSSSPTIVGTPAESYDLLYGDNTYAAFRSNYRSRRQMVYVGANDGMLHAFNSGFYVSAQAATSGNPTIYRQLPSSLGLTTGDPTITQGNNWALGQEAWAFVPDNLLPHLRWMAQKNYTHVFYVDGAPVVTDAQVFGASGSAGCQSGTPASSDVDAKGHVCGWGTVMVVPFRLGGGPIQVDTVGTGLPITTQSSNSAYVILDITDPEQPPTVLGEITTGTFALGSPAFAVHRESDGKLHFLLTLGSGPADNGGPTGTTTKPVAAPTSTYFNVNVYDLANLATVAANSTSTTSVAPVASLTASGNGLNSFTSDMVASDFDLNYSAEGVYFGTVANPPTSATLPQVFGGGLWKVNMNTGPTGTGVTTPPDTSDPSTWTLSQVINLAQPVTIRPSITVDSNGRSIVYFGTGRSYTTNDDSGGSAQGTQQQYIYAVSDNSLLTTFPASCQTMPTLSSLFSASSVNVSDGTNTALGTVSGTGISGLGAAATLGDLETALSAQAAAVPLRLSAAIRIRVGYSR